MRKFEIHIETVHGHTHGGGGGATFLTHVKVIVRNISCVTTRRRIAFKHVKYSL